MNSNQLIIVLQMLYTVSSNNHFTDYRCRCICPSLTVVPLGQNLTDTGRRIYIGAVQKEHCNCEQVVFNISISGNLSQDFQGQFCPRCQCDFELRRTATVQTVVGAIIVLVLFLMTYMAILLCLEPNADSETTVHGDTSHEQGFEFTRQIDDDEQRNRWLQVDDNAQYERYQSSRLINRMSRKQTEWQQAVERQRENVFDDDGTIFA
ncbi:hypothetical protein ACOME3_002349 [Neoechinorhynchus agilis]